MGRGQEDKSKEERGKEDIMKNRREEEERRNAEGNEKR
jgi:hypothetical protein